jgi:hypothetical protein
MCKKTANATQERTLAVYMTFIHTMCIFEGWKIGQQKIFS